MIGTVEQLTHTNKVSWSRTIGAVLLVGGSCIGAGMLALPVVTGLAGFLPATLLFVVCWAFMATTALLLLEVNLWLGERISIVTMAERTLGLPGKIISWVLFCFLFYLILVAYSAACGAMFSSFVRLVFGPATPNWMGSLLFALFFGVLVYLGTRPVDLVNRYLMVGLIVSYVLLIGGGVSHVSVSLLTHVQWSAIIIAAPVVVISFGFHNMIPSLTRYLHGHRTHMLLVVIVGSLIPLVVYVVWEWLMLGIIPATGEGSFAESLQQGDLVTAALRRTVGGWISAVADSFAFFALVTSYLAQALSLVHFIADGFHVWKGGKRHRALLCFVVLTPPFFAALLDPSIFIRALEYAGAFSAVILFGILPALMVWVGRYKQRQIEYRIVPGGRWVLTAIIFFAVTVIVVQLLHQMGTL